MSGLLQVPWYARFRAEMEAIGCKFQRPTIGDEDIEVPLDKMAEARAIILKYSDRAARKQNMAFDDTLPRGKT